MPNRNYQRGRAKEYRIMGRLREEGYDIVLRSAGSHSKIDVLGIRKSDQSIKCIQSKPSTITEAQKRKIFSECYWLNGFFNVEFEVI